MVTAFHEYIAKQTHSYLIGPSGNSDCYRKQAYKYGGYPEQETPKEAANLGTLLHLGWSNMLSQMFDPDERRGDVPVIIPGLPRSGEADDVDFKNQIVTDVKSTSARSFDYWANKGIPTSIWDQLQLYAFGLTEEYGPTWRIRVVAIDRESGRMAEYDRKFFPNRAAKVIAKLKERHESIIAALSCGEGPDAFPREGTGSGFPCDWCGFREVCWA